MHQCCYSIMIGFIYKIECMLNDYVYIGATKQRLSQAFATIRLQYRTGTRSDLNDKFHKYGIHNFKIVLLETVEYNNRYELIQKKVQYEKRMIKKQPSIPTTRCISCNQSFKSHNMYLTHLKKENHLKSSVLVYRLLFNKVIHQLHLKNNY